MESPIIFYTTNIKNLIDGLFSGNEKKEVILDRAKIRFEESTIHLERPEVKVKVTITMLTQFGAAPVSNYISEKLKNDGVTQIEIGNKKHKILNDEIRESLLGEFSN